MFLFRFSETKWFKLSKLFFYWDKKSRKLNENFNLQKRDQISEDPVKLKQFIIEKEVENSVLTSKNEKILIECDNSIETRIYTDNVSNDSNSKNKEDKIKRIQNAFRNYKSKKLIKQEKIQLNEIDFEEKSADNLINQEVKNNVYIRNSLKNNNEFNMNNYASADFLENFDSKGKEICFE